MRPIPKKYVFLPLLALAAAELAPSVDAAPGDRSSRGSSVSSSSGSSRSSGSVGRSSGGSSRSSGSVGRSSGGSSRSSGSVGRSSGGSSRSSGSVGRSSGGSSRSSGSVGRSSGSSSRSSGSVGRSSNDSSRSSGSYDRQSSGSSRSSGRVSTPLVTGNAPSTGSDTTRARFTTPTPTPAPSYSAGAAARSGSLDATGEAYAPAARPLPFPTPNNSGRTTYARRFETADQPFGGRQASTETGGTLGARGVGSVTSALAAERRALASRGPASPDPITARGSEARVRSPHSPGAQFRRELTEATNRRRGLTAEASAPTRDSASTALREQGEGRVAAARPDSPESLRQETVRRRMAAALDPEGSKLVSTASRRTAMATGAVVSAATRPLVGEAGARALAGPFNGDGYGGTDHGDDYGDGYGYTGPYGGEDCYWNYGFGYWDSFGNYHSPYGHHSWWGWSFGWSTSWGLHLSLGWDWWDCYGWGWGPSYYPPYAYYPSVVHHYYYDDYYQPDPIVIYDDPDPVVIHIYDDDPVGETVYVEGDGVEVIDHGADGRVVPAVAPAPAEPTIGAAGLRYLELGDAAFSEQRFGDAVYFYARAVEFEPEVGMLHLVLADALFATGDYRYGAHSIRKALDLEPTLVDAPVDKHQFYADPTDFDRQVAVLELYLAEQPTDVDARLVLALNQLFGGRPLAAMELLDEAPASSRGLDPAVELIRAAADRARWGANPPAEALIGS